MSSSDELIDRLRTTRRSALSKEYLHSTALALADEIKRLRKALRDIKKTYRPHYKGCICPGCEALKGVRVR